MYYVYLLHAGAGKSINHDLITWRYTLSGAKPTWGKWWSSTAFSPSRVTSAPAESR